LNCLNQTSSVAERLPIDSIFIFTQLLWGDALAKLVGMRQTLVEDLIKTR